MTAKAKGMLSSISRKVSVGAAACVIAAAAALTPAPDAQANPIAPLPLASAGTLGGSAGGDAELVACDPIESAECAAIATTTLLPGGLETLWKNKFLWLGAPNPAPPPQTVVFNFFPVALIPDFLLPFFGWFADVNFEICVAGLTLQIGPYGTVTGSYSKGCA